MRRQIKMPKLESSLPLLVGEALEPRPLSVAFTSFSGAEDAAVEGLAAALFRASKDEEWRRSRLAISD
jgi:hypothetical protein